MYIMSIITIMCIMLLIYIIVIMHFIAVCLLNLHEDERMKPRNWIPVGWIPCYDDSRDKRPGKGFESTAARKI